MRELFLVATHQQCTHPFVPWARLFCSAATWGGQVEAKGEQAGTRSLDILSQRGRFQTHSLSGSPEKPWLSLTLPLPAASLKSAQLQHMRCLFYSHCSFSTVNDEVDGPGQNGVASGNPCYTPHDCVSSDFSSHLCIFLSVQLRRLNQTTARSFTAPISLDYVVH